MRELEKKLEEVVIDFTNRKTKLDNETIEKRQIIMNKFSDKIGTIESEIEQLNEQLKNLDEQKAQIKEEMDDFLDKNSGFYQDMQQEFESKDKETEQIKSQIAVKNRDIKLLESQRNQEKEKMTEEAIKQEDLLREELEEAKAEVIAELEKKLKLVDENRKVKIDDNLEDLKKEKEELEKQIAFNDLSKEEIDALDSEKKKEVLLGRERYLINKKRLSEISPKIEILEALDGQEPKKRYLDIMATILAVKNNLTLENLEKYSEKINDRRQQEHESRLKSMKEEYEAAKTKAGIKETLRANKDSVHEGQMENAGSVNVAQQSAEKINLKPEDIQAARARVLENAKKREDAKAKNVQESKTEPEVKLKSEEEKEAMREKIRENAEKRKVANAEQEAKMASKTKTEPEVKFKSEEEKKAMRERIRENAKKSEAAKASAKQQSINEAEVEKELEKMLETLIEEDKKSEEAKAKSEQASKKESGVKSEQKEGKIKGENKTTDKAGNGIIEVNYTAKDDTYTLKYNGNELQMPRTKLTKLLDKELLLMVYGKDLYEYKNVDDDLMKLFYEYDSMFGNFDFKTYFECLTNLEKGKESNDKKMQITYDLRDIYEGIWDGTNVFSDQERLEILENANRAKELGIGTVKKGWKVAILEKIDRFISKFTMKKIGSGENKEKTTKTKNTSKAKNTNKSKTKTKTKIKNKPKMNFERKVHKFVKAGKNKVTNVVNAVKDFKNQYVVDKETMKKNYDYFERTDKAAKEMIEKANNKPNNKDVHKLTPDEYEELGK